MCLDRASWNCSQILFLGLNNTFFCSNFVSGFNEKQKCIIPLQFTPCMVFSRAGRSVLNLGLICVCCTYVGLLGNSWRLFWPSAATPDFPVSLLPPLKAPIPSAPSSRSLCLWKHASPIHTAIKCDQWKAPLLLVQRANITSLAQSKTRA